MAADRSGQNRRKVIRGAGLLVVIVAAVGGLHVLVGRTVDPHDGARGPAAVESAQRVEAPAVDTSVLQEGSTIFVPHSDRPGFAICTVGAVLDADTALTARHCAATPEAMVYLSTGSAAEPVAQFLAPVTGSPYDIAYLRIRTGVTVGRLSRISDRGLSRGAAVAKYGSATGRTTGVVITGAPERFALVGAVGGHGAEGLGVRTSLCANRGDSGSPVYLQGTHTVAGVVIATADPGGAEATCTTFVSPLSSSMTRP